MFGKKYTLSLNRVHDSIRVKEGNDTLDLTVDADPMRMVAALNKAQKVLKSVNDESKEEDIRSAALLFASAIFGDVQAHQILEFYHDDAGCVINLCGRYFADRLSGIITKVQKRSK